MNRPGKILAVDDEEAVLEIYCEELAGWDVHTAKSYADAVKQLESGDWSVVLIDQKLRDGGAAHEGLSLIDEVNRLSPGARAIVVTGYASPEAIEKAYLHGVHEYIEKTESFTTLLKLKVRNAMELAREHWLASTGRDQKIDEVWQKVQTETDTHRKGRYLEDLCDLLLREVPGFTVVKRQRSEDEEFDLLVQNESADLFWAKESQYFIVECKNWTSKVGPEEFDRLRSKLRRRFGRAKLGFLVAVGGFTAGIQSTLSASREQENLIVPLDCDDLSKLVASDDRAETLKGLVRRTIEGVAT